MESGHRSEDYKISAVLYYIEHDEVSMDDVCEIFKCTKSTLRRWIIRYQDTKNIKRLNRPAVSYKITDEQVKYAIKLMKDNEQITVEALLNKVKEKYKDFFRPLRERDITPQWLGKVSPLERKR